MYDYKIKQNDKEDIRTKKYIFELKININCNFIN